MALPLQKGGRAKSFTILRGAQKALDPQFSHFVVPPPRNDWSLSIKENMIIKTACQAGRGSLMQLYLIMLHHTRPQLKEVYIVKG